MVQRLSREQMIMMVQNILEPSEDSSEEEVTEQLNTVAMNCPDPVSAYDFIVDTPESMTVTELVERVLSMPPRDPATVPESELARNDPFRTMKLDP